MTHMSRGVALIIILQAMSSLGSGQEMADLWTQNEHIQIAPFHVLFIYAFQRKEARATQVHIENVVEKFNGDVRALSHDPRSLKRDPRFADFAIHTNVRANCTPINSKQDLNEEFTKLAKKINPDDVAFIYILSHAAKTDADDILFQIGSDTVDRADVVGRAERLRVDQKARLVILITDNCSEPLPQPSPVTDSSGEGSIWRALYFGHEGFVQISSSNPKKRQKAFLADKSLFSVAFGNALALSSIESELPAGRPLTQKEKGALFVRLLDKNEDKVVSWTEFAPHLQKQMNKTFKDEMGMLDKETDKYRMMDAQEGGQEIIIVDSSTVRRAR